MNSLLAFLGPAYWLGINSISRHIILVSFAQAVMGYGWVEIIALLLFFSFRRSCDFYHFYRYYTFIPCSQCCWWVFFIDATVAAIVAIQLRWRMLSIYDSQWNWLVADTRVQSQIIDVKMVDRFPASASYVSISNRDSLSSIETKSSPGIRILKKALFWMSSISGSHWQYLFHKKSEKPRLYNVV